MDEDLTKSENDYLAMGWDVVPKLKQRYQDSAFSREGRLEVESDCAVAIDEFEMLIEQATEAGRTHFVSEGTKIVSALRAICVD
jgi:ubiquinone biosynthesis protein UbiJ